METALMQVPHTIIQPLTMAVQAILATQAVVSTITISKAITSKVLTAMETSGEATDHLTKYYS